MKYIKPINEFNRTIGFRYSKPKNKFRSILYCFGELTQEDLSNLLEHLDVPYENISIINDEGVISFEEGDMEYNLQVSFDFLVYSEMEIEKIIEDVRFGLSREFDVETINFTIKELPRLKKQNESESYSVFDSEGWKKFLPKKLNLVTDNGSWVLELPQEDYGMGHPTNVANLMNCIQINYYQNTPSREDGDVTRDAEPDQLEFDITIVKNNDGNSANPDTLKLDVDITYGDAMAVEFTIEKPNKINVTHYTGFGSLYDPNSYFGFEDESLEEIVNFFNSWGYQLTTKDFTFLDKYPDSYIHQKTNETIQLNPSFNKEYILIVNNSKPQENRYLTNVIKYLDFRGISWQIASTPEEVKKMNDEFDIIGAILTGSDYRVKDAEESSIDINEKAYDILNCPIFAICYGMQLMGKHYGLELKEGEHIHGSYKLTDYKEHYIFKGLDMENTDFSFSFRDYLSECPTGFEVIGNLNDKIVAIANDEKRQYGTLFHPEDIEYTYKVLDNFIDMCDGGQSKEVEDLKGDMKMTNVVESYLQFLKRIKK